MVDPTSSNTFSIIGAGGGTGVVSLVTRLDEAARPRALVRVLGGILPTA